MKMIKVLGLFLLFGGFCLAVIGFFLTMTGKYDPLASSTATAFGFGLVAAGRLIIKKVEREKNKSENIKAQDVEAD